jgi:hypothetical protein
MLSRIVTAILLASIFLPVFSFTQENNEVVLGTFKDQFTAKACGIGGQTYFSRVDRDPANGATNAYSVSEVSRDGSIMTFQIPEGMTPVAVAVNSSGLSVLAAYPHRLHEDCRYEIYQYDNQANVRGHYLAGINFHPLQMAVLPSGKTILVGHSGDISWSRRDEWTYVGAVLDTVGGVITRFEFPLPGDGGKWTLSSREKMVAGDAAAYIVLESDSDPGIAKITEGGAWISRPFPRPLTMTSAATAFGSWAPALRSRSTSTKARGRAFECITTNTTSILAEKLLPRSLPAAPRNATSAPRSTGR